MNVYRKGISGVDIRRVSLKARYDNTGLCHEFILLVLLRLVLPLGSVLRFADDIHISGDGAFDGGIISGVKDIKFYRIVAGLHILAHGKGVDQILAQGQNILIGVVRRNRLNQLGIAAVLDFKGEIVGGYAFHIGVDDHIRQLGVTIVDYRQRNCDRFSIFNGRDGKIVCQE